jgi:hypothetical protein
LPSSAAVTTADVALNPSALFGPATGGVAEALVRRAGVALAGGEVEEAAALGEPASAVAPAAGGDETGALELTAADPEPAGLEAAGLEAAGLVLAAVAAGWLEVHPATRTPANATATASGLRRGVRTRALAGVIGPG